MCDHFDDLINVATHFDIVLMNLQIDDNFFEKTQIIDICEDQFDRLNSIVDEIRDMNYDAHDYMLFDVHSCHTSSLDQQVYGAVLIRYVHHVLHDDIVHHRGNSIRLNFLIGVSLNVRKPRPHGGGPLGAYRGSIPAGYGTGNSRTRKFLRGCTPGTRMTLHHHPDRVATSDFENSNFEFGVCLRKPRPHGGGPLGAYRGFIPAGYGTGNSRTRKFLRGCTRMTTQILIIQIQEFNRGRVDRSSPPAPWSLFPPSALAPGLCPSAWP
ncbi:hypothetical protein PAPYR_11551 [Paratrimastix pyriformis]|uniref:Uncharacterized protein n=1 Tax=Paratrimastix pyriformis TaxID=342808 RepID=A0ABQ8U3G7_9EUKA|nr:hypothetical protein PAPYR_11551 [Paratrimastix pyriformis]